MDSTWHLWRRGVYPHGLLCGFLMALVAFWIRDWDLPVPLVAAVLCTPYCMVPGFQIARRGGAGLGVLAGGVTGATGNVVVFVFMTVYSAINQPWPMPMLWLMAGTLALAAMFLFGMFFGGLGAALCRAVDYFRLPTR